MASTINDLKSLFSKAKKKVLDSTTIDEKIGQGVRDFQARNQAASQQRGNFGQSLLNNAQRATRSFERGVGAVSNLGNKLPVISQTNNFVRELGSNLAKDITTVGTSLRAGTEQVGFNRANQLPTFQNTGQIAKQGALPLTRAVTYPLNVLAPGGFAAFSGFSGAVNKAQGNSFTQGAVQGAQNAGIGKLVQGATNPIFNRFLPKGASFAANRLSPGLANVAQGITYDQATGSQTNVLSLGMDLATGALGGRGQFGRPIAKGAQAQSKTVATALKKEKDITQIINDFNDPRVMKDPIRGGETIQKAEAIWKELYGKSGKPTSANMVVGDLFDALSGAKTERSMRSQGYALGLMGGQNAKVGKPNFSSRLDKKPRFEIDDSGAKLTKAAAERNFYYPNVQKGILSEYIEHPKLFEQYPELKNAKVSFVETSDVMGDGSRAAYDPRANQITINTKWVNRAKNDEVKSTLLHEIQHAIQEIEGFARGGNPGNAVDQTLLGKVGKDEYFGALDNIDGAFQKRIDELGIRDSFAQLFKNSSDENISKYNQIVKNDPILRQLEQDRQAWSLQKKLSDNPMEAYKRLSGELEARAVQRRMDLPGNQRSQSDPYAAEARATTGTTNPNDFITRFDGGSSASVKNPFPESKVKKPVYHGTANRFDTFDVEKYGENWGGDLGKGIYFTDKPEIARSFAKDAGGDIVMEAHLNIKNPATNKVMLSKEVQNALDDGMGFEEISDVLRKKGYDGIEFKHKDGSTEYVVFDPKQIKTTPSNIMASVESTSPVAGMPTVQLKQPVQRGDITKLQKNLDEVLGTKSFNATGKWQANLPARQTAKKQLEFYAEQGEPDARKLLDYVNKLENDIATAQTTRVQVPQPTKGAEPIKQLTVKGGEIVEETKKPILRTQLTGKQLGMTNEQLKFVEATGKQSRVKVKKATDTTKIVDEETTQRNLAEALFNEDPSVAQDQTAIRKLVEGVNSVFAPIKNTSQGFQDSFTGWLNKRAVARTTANSLANQYRSVPEELSPQIIDYMQGVSKTVSPEVKQIASSMRSELNSLYTQAKQAGIDVKYLDDYLTNIWLDTPEQIQKIVQQSLGQNFKFAKQRVIPNYREGIKLGLTPKFSNPAQIIAEYTRKLNETKANIELFTELKNQNIIVSAKEAAGNSDFAPIIASGFPQSRAFDGKSTVVGNYYAPKKLAELINRQFSEQQAVPVISWLADLSGRVQDISLSGGLPGTPLNAFTIAQGTKEFLAGRPLAPIRATWNSLTTDRANKYFTEKAPLIKEMQANGIPLSRTSFDYENLAQNSYLKQTFGEKAERNMANAWNGAFNNPTFQRFMPMLQVQLYDDVKSALVKSGKSNEEAARIASENVKRFYGIVDEQALGRSRGISDSMSALFFAPKYRESMVNLWANVAKLADPRETLKPENQTTLRFAIGALLTYGAMNALNKATTGGWMWENPEGKKDKLLVSAGDTTIGIPYLSSIATIPRALAGIAGNLVTGNTQEAGKNIFKLASKPLQIGGNLLSNEDYFGNEIYNETDPGATKGLKQAQYVIGQTIPPYLREGSRIAVNAATGTENKPAYQTASQTLELPFRFYKTDSIKNAPFWEAYRKNKPIGERYEELQYKDPAAALTFLEKNRATITEYQRQKAYVSQYYNQEKDPKVLEQYLSSTGKKVGVNQAQASTGTTIATDRVSRDFIKERIKLGDTVSNDEVVAAYLGDVTSLPSKTKYEQNIKTKKLFSKISDVTDNENLSEEQKSVLLDTISKEAGLTRDDIDYYEVARQDTDIKMGAIYDELDTLGNDQEKIVEFLESGRYEVNGQRLVNDSVIDNLYDDGIISESEKKYLKSLKWDGKDKKVKVKKSKAKKIKLGSTPTIKVNKASAPQAVSMPKISFNIPEMSRSRVPVRKSSTRPRINVREASRRLLNVVR